MEENPDEKDKEIIELQYAKARGFSYFCTKAIRD